MVRTRPTKCALAAELGISVMTLRHRARALGLAFTGPMNEKVIAALRAAARTAGTKRPGTGVAGGG